MDSCPDSSPLLGTLSLTLVRGVTRRHYRRLETGTKASWPLSSECTVDSTYSPIVLRIPEVWSHRSGGLPSESLCK